MSRRPRRHAQQNVDGPVGRVGVVGFEGHEPLLSQVVLDRLPLGVGQRPAIDQNLGDVARPGQPLAPAEAADLPAGVRSLHRQVHPGQFADLLPVAKRVENARAAVEPHAVDGEAGFRRVHRDDRVREALLAETAEGDDGLRPVEAAQGQRRFARDLAPAEKAVEIVRPFGRLHPAAADRDDGDVPVVRIVAEGHGLVAGVVERDRAQARGRAEFAVTGAAGAGGGVPLAARGVAPFRDGQARPPAGEDRGVEPQFQTLGDRQFRPPGDRREPQADSEDRDRPPAEPLTHACRLPSETVRRRLRVVARPVLGVA